MNFLNSVARLSSIVAERTDYNILHRRRFIERISPSAIAKPVTFRIQPSMQSTFGKHGPNSAFLRVALTPFVWLFLFALAMYVVVSAFFEAEIGQQIPFAVNASCLFVILGTVPANLAIYSIMVEPTFRMTSDRNHALVAWILFLGILAASLFVGFQVVDLLTEISWFHKLLLLAPFPIASTVTFGLYGFMSVEQKKRRISSPSI